MYTIAFLYCLSASIHIGTCIIRSDVHCAPRKCRAITEMLTERVVLRAAPTDRVLLGAKNLLLKYTLCSLAHYVGIRGDSKSAGIP